MGQGQRSQIKFPTLPSLDFDDGDGLGKYFAKLAAFGTFDPVFVRQNGATANYINSFTVPEDSV